MGWAIDAPEIRAVEGSKLFDRGGRRGSARRALRKTMYELHSRNHSFFRPRFDRLPQFAQKLLKKKIRAKDWFSPRSQRILRDL
jgi:hypothetical protein